MFVVCGNSIEEIENDLVALKSAVKTGALMGAGGQTIEATEKAVKALKELAENYQSKCSCCPKSKEEEKTWGSLGEALTDLGFNTEEDTLYVYEDESEEDCPKSCSQVGAGMIKKIMEQYLKSL